MQKRIAIVLICLVAAAVVVLRADRHLDMPLAAPLSTFPMRIGDWTGRPQPPLSREVEEVLGADDYLTRAYFDAHGRGLGLFVGYWASQRQGDTMHSPLNCLPGAGWEPVERGYLSLPDPRNPAGLDLTVNRIVIQKGLERQLVLYWYQSHGRVVASEYWGKFYLMADAMRLNRTDGAIVRLVVPLGPDDQIATTTSEEAANGHPASTRATDAPLRPTASKTWSNNRSVPSRHAAPASFCVTSKVAALPPSGVCK